MFFCPEFILRELGLNRACRTVVDLEGSLDAIEVISQAEGAWLYCTRPKTRNGDLID